MPRNVEIKAKATDFPRQRRLAAELGDRPPELLEQVDFFFHCPAGRLKLRCFGDGTGELIHYERANSTHPRPSTYRRCPVSDPAGLHATLASALGERGVVRKRRHLYLTGRTRIHLDEVEGLGCFIELEVVLGAVESIDTGAEEAERLASLLEIGVADRIGMAYIDLLEAVASGGQGQSPD